MLYGQPVVMLDVIYYEILLKLVMILPPLLFFALEEAEAMIIIIKTNVITATMILKFLVQKDFIA